MLNFKQYLREAEVNQYDLTKQIIRLYQKNKADSVFANSSNASPPFPRHTVHPDGSITIEKTFKVSAKLLKDGELPFPIRSCGQILLTQRTCKELKSFKNFPEILTGATNVQSSNQFISASFHSDGYNDTITSLEGFPKQLKEAYLQTFETLNYSNVHKYIKSANIIIINEEYVGPILGFLKIQNLKSISCAPNRKQYGNRMRMNKVIDIIRKYLKGNKDIIACSEELIEAGLKEYAKL